MGVDADRITTRHERHERCFSRKRRNKIHSMIMIGAALLRERKKKGIRDFGTQRTSTQLYSSVLQTEQQSEKSSER